MITLESIIQDVSYEGNLGFHEVFTFYNKASDEQIEQLEQLLSQKEFRKAWKFIQKVTGMPLQGASFN